MMAASTTNPRVYLASYKGTAKGLHGIVSRGIRTFDKAQYSHCEIVVTEASPAHTPYTQPMLHMSASGMDHGVRAKWMQLNPAKWDVLYLPFADPQEVLRHHEARQTHSKGYDYFGTGRFLLPWLLREHPTRDFCSEFCGAALGFYEAWRKSPQGLHMQCLDMGAQRVLPPQFDLEQK